MCDIGAQRRTVVSRDVCAKVGRRCGTQASNNKDYPCPELIVAVHIGVLWVDSSKQCVPYKAAWGVDCVFEVKLLDKTCF